VDALQEGNEIELRGFGAFRLRTRNPRIGRNPKSGTPVDVPGKTIVFFKMGRDLKEFLKQS
jgi:integration host factor subunit beta